MVIVSDKLSLMTSSMKWAPDVAFRNNSEPICVLFVLLFTACGNNILKKLDFISFSMTFRINISEISCTVCLKNVQLFFQQSISHGYKGGQTKHGGFVT